MGKPKKNQKFTYPREYDNNRKSFHSQNQYQYFRNDNYRRDQGFVQKRYHSEMRYRYPQNNLRFTINKEAVKKLPPRPNSPFEGSEEYTDKKIQKTSAIIMRHLLSPEENIISIKNIHAKKSDVMSQTQTKRKQIETTQEIIDLETQATQESINLETHTSKYKKSQSYNVEEIHNKIMTHLINLNDGRKKNLISNRTSVFDSAINQILKQKRLEVSRALRSVCLKSSDVTESTNWINSIIPNMGIKIEDLPQEVLEELQITFSIIEDSETFPISPRGFSEDNLICSAQTEDIPETFIMPNNSPCEIVEILKSDILMDCSSMSGFLTPAHSDVIQEKTVSPPLNPINTPLVHSDEEIVTNKPSTSKNVENSKQIESHNSDFNEENEIIPNPTSCGSKSNHIDKGILFNNSPQNNFETTVTPEPSTSKNIDNFSKSDYNYRNEVTPNSTPCPKESIETNKEMSIEDFLQNNFKEPPDDYSEAIERMLIIDKYIAVMTEYRQKLFINLKEKHQIINVTDNVENTTLELQLQLPNDSHQSKSNSDNLNNVQKFLEFEDIPEKVLVLKLCEDRLLAATEGGNIHFYNIKNGKCENILKATSVPITSLWFKKEEDDKPFLFVGSREPSLKVYNLYSGCLLYDFSLDDDVQCMDENWGYIFLGCIRGTIIRYSIKKQQLENQEQFSSNPVFVLKASQEGTRKVLIIGSKNSPVLIRDAMSGLHLRSLGIMFPTIYSLLIHKHFVICGTSLFNILLFNFHNGILEHTLNMNEKGIACMKIVGKCLFASCHNGKIYAFNLETKTLVDTMCGPGGVIISMEVLSNQVIVGTLSLKFTSIPISHSILSHMN